MAKSDVGANRDLPAERSSKYPLEASLIFLLVVVVVVVVEDVEDVDGGSDANVKLVFSPLALELLALLVPNVNASAADAVGSAITA